MSLLCVIRETEAAFTVGRLPRVPRNHWVTPGSLRVDPIKKLACYILLTIDGDQ